MTADIAARRVLVTGGKGRIGTAVGDRLRASGADVVVADLPETDLTGYDAVAAAMVGIDLVVHLGAIPSPYSAPWPQTFSTNVTATYNVLHAAAEHGVTRAVIASSIQASGLPFAAGSGLLPPYFPFDERIPPMILDPYSLSKSVDEQTALAIHRRFGLDVVAFRFPLTAPADVLQRVSEKYAVEPGPQVGEGWTYLDVRDAARAVELALVRPVTGVHPVLLAADQTLSPYPTDDLLDRFAPDVPRLRPFVGREIPADLTRARTLLGFRAEHVIDVAPLPLPGV